MALGWSRVAVTVTVPPSATAPASETERRTGFGGVPASSSARVRVWTVVAPRAMPLPPSVRVSTTVSAYSGTASSTTATSMSTLVALAGTERLPEPAMVKSSPALAVPPTV